MTAPIAIEIADYLDNIVNSPGAGRWLLASHDQRLDAAEHILTIIDNAAPTPGDDLGLGLIALRKLRAFANEYANDPINDDEDCWAGSAADHAEQLYNILQAIGLKP